MAIVSFPKGIPLNATQAKRTSTPRVSTALPSDVICPFAKQPNCSSKSVAVSQEETGGSSSHDTFSKEDIPHSAHSSTNSVKSVRIISGGVSVVRTSDSFQRRIHFP